MTRPTPPGPVKGETGGPAVGASGAGGSDVPGALAGGLLPLLDAVGGGLILLDREGRVRCVSSSAAELLPGVEAGARADSLAELLGLEDERSVVETHRGRDTTEAGPALRWRPGAGREIELSALPGRDGAGAWRAVRVRDVTTDAAGGSDGRLSELVHALRSPFQGILTGVDFLSMGRDGELSPDQRADVERIEESADRLRWELRSAEGLLALGLAGRDGVRGVEVDPADLLERAFGEGVQLRGAPLRVDHRLPGDHPPVCGDPRLLRYLLLAAVRAVAAWTGGGGPVEVTSRPVRGARGRASLRIAAARPEGRARDGDPGEGRDREVADLEGRAEREMIVARALASAQGATVEADRGDERVAVTVRLPLHRRLG